MPPNEKGNAGLEAIWKPFRTEGSMADRRLQVLHAVAKHLSLTRAAEALLMTQRASALQIAPLQARFDARLFMRGHGQPGQDTRKAAAAAPA